MSLVLIAHNANVGALASEGRSSVWKNGKWAPYEDDSFKFVPLNEHMVVATTGEQSLCRELKARSVEFTRDFQGCPKFLFSALCEFLPTCAREIYSRWSEADHAIELSVSLLGFDGISNRVRSAIWTHKNGFAADERDDSPGVWIQAVGHHDVICAARDSLIAKLEQAGQYGTAFLCEAMQRTIASLACAHDVINDNVRLYVVRRPPIVEVGAERTTGKSLGVLVDRNLNYIDDTSTRVAPSPARMDAAIDSSGNLLLKNIAQSAGMNSGSTSNANFVYMGANVAQTITTHGKPVLCVLCGSFYVDTAGHLGGIAIFRDGSQISLTETVEVGYPVPVCITWIDNPAAGSHTYAGYWFVLTGTIFGTNMYLQVVELA